MLVGKLAEILRDTRPGRKVTAMFIDMAFAQTVRPAEVEERDESAEFDLMVKQVPSGIPQPDEHLRIHKAGQASRAALQNYMRALKRFAG